MKNILTIAIAFSLCICLVGCKHTVLVSKDCEEPVTNAYLIYGFHPNLTKVELGELSSSPKEVECVFPEGKQDVRYINCYSVFLVYKYRGKWHMTDYICGDDEKGFYGTCDEIVVHGDSISERGNFFLAKWHTAQAEDNPKSPHNPWVLKRTVDEPVFQVKTVLRP